jgi:exopolysaccharide biosynthesis polyprenyl glycosylphosphotransferase
MSVSDSVQQQFRPAAVSVLPHADVRHWLDERAVRGWTESSRRVVRCLTLYTVDSVASILAIVTVLGTWTLIAGERSLPDEVPLMATVFFLLPLSLRVTGAYAGGKSYSDIYKVAFGVVIATLIGWTQAQLFGRRIPATPDKAAYVYLTMLLIINVWVFRATLYRLVIGAYHRGLLQRRVLVIASVAEARDLDRRCRETSGSEIRIVGRIIPDLAGESTGTDGSADNQIPTFGSIDDLKSALSVTRSRGVIVVASLPFSRLEGVVSSCFQLGAALSLMPQSLKSLPGTQLEVRQTAIGSFLQLNPVRLGIPQLAVKRTMDVLLTLFGLALIWPLLVAVAIAVKLDSSGPVLFRQTRIGVGGRRFGMIKFRTMVVGADGLKASLQHLNDYPDARLFKIKVDPRVTRLGKYLRKYSLDELPQLWNVVRGDMSLVGPRPCVPEEMEQYAQHHLERLTVVPGVTGPWQVNGRNNILDFEEVVRLDREYIQSWSLTKDVIILVRTIPTLCGRGAC